MAGSYCRLGSKTLEEVNVFKYLGIKLSNNGSLNLAKKDLLQRGYKAMFKLLNVIKGTKPAFKTCMHLFYHFVKPLLLYGSDIWGDTC